MATDAIAASIDEARRWVTNAQTATEGISRPELRAGLSRLVAELLSDVP
jgi:hypothetical protein